MSILIRQIATGREGSLFQPDIDSRDQQLRDAIAGKRILVVGGAGSIGSNTVM